MKKRSARKSMDKQQKKEEKLLNRETGLTNALMNRETRVELSGSREAVIDGCRGIIEYNETQIRLNTAEGQLAFSGRNLQIVGMAEDSMMIRGYIMGLKYSN